MGKMVVCVCACALTCMCRSCTGSVRTAVNSPRWWMGKAAKGGPVSTAAGTSDHWSQRGSMWAGPGESGFLALVFSLKSCSKQN